MIEVKTYNNQTNPYSMEKDVENKPSVLSDKETETASIAQEAIKHSNGRLTPMRKIRRTKSAGIF